MNWWSYNRKPGVHERRQKAAREARRFAKNGKMLSPVAIEGRAIARSFWGKAWCDNLESYRDFENRLPRGRSYVRNGSVLDLQIASGKITALVSGSDLYDSRGHAVVSSAASDCARLSSALSFGNVTVSRGRPCSSRSRH